MKIKNAQSVLDFILALMAIGILTVGIIRIWIWSNANFAKHRVEYEATRSAAGRGDHPGCIDCGSHEPLKNLPLNDKLVFQGIPSGTINLQGDVGNYEPPEQDCQEDSVGQPGCGTMENFNFNCPAYIKCMCIKNSEATIQTYFDMRDSLNAMADSLDDTADSMMDAVEECDEWFEPCTWNGSSAHKMGELKKAAKEIYHEADKIRKRANVMEEIANDIKHCCDRITVNEQYICKMRAEAKADCDSGCSTSNEEDFRACKDQCSVDYTDCRNKCMELWLYNPDFDLIGCFTGCYLTREGCEDNCYSSAGDYRNCYNDCIICTGNCIDDCIDEGVLNYSCYSSCVEGNGCF
jgi:hypothetical protein